MKSILCAFFLSFFTFSATANSEDGSLKSDTISGTSKAVDYKVTQTQGNIMVQLVTRDNKTMMGMLRHGVTVFFDLKGKEKEDIAMTYPIIEPIRMSMQPEADRGNGREASFQSEADIKQMKAQINTLVTTDFPEEALFKLNDSKQNFNVLLNGIGISATYSYNQEENILTYKLSIPKAKLKTKAKDDFSKLMIGVQTAKPEQSKRNENTTMGNEMGSRGGGRGNRQAGGGRGGSRGGGQRPGGDSERKPQGIDFWFEAHL